MFEKQKSRNDKNRTVFSPQRNFKVLQTAN